MRILTDGIMIGFGIGASIYDLKRKAIPVKFLWIYTLVTFISTFIHIEGNLKRTMGGCLIGLLFWIAAKVTKETIGYGDCWIITLFGMYLGWKSLVRLLFTASFLVGIASLFYLWRQNWKRGGSLPFLPFLTFGLMEVIFL